MNESRTLLCPPIVNFGGNTYKKSVSDANRITTVTDRRLDTYSSESVFVLDTVQDAANTDVTHLYIKGKGITRIQISGVGVVGAAIDQQAAAYAVQNAQGGTTDYEADGYQNFLFGLNRTGHENWNVNRITITITGDPHKQVYEIAAFNAVMVFDSQRYYRQLAYNRTHRGSRLREYITGRVKRIDPVNKEPHRWRVRTALKNRWMNDPPIGKTLQNFFDTYPNFAMIPEYSRWTDRVFSAATLENPEYQLNFLGDNTESYEMLVSILEA